MKRLVLIVLMLSVVGCRRVTELGGGSPGGPSRQASPYDGQWAGLTSQGLPMQFKVENGALTEVSNQWKCNPSDFMVQSSTRQFFFPYEIVNASVTVNNYFGLDFSGRFTTLNTADGSMRESFTSCSGPISVTWSATHN